MKRMLGFGLAATLLLCGVGEAFAQDQPKGKDDPDYVQDPNDPNVLYKKKTEYDFEDDVVEGSFVRPEGEYIESRRRGRYSSLIKIRENFVPEMLKSAEDI
jgi:hypothetical protein